MHMMIASLTINLQVITPKRIIFPNRWSRSDLRFSIALYLSSHRTKTINPLALASLRCGVPKRVLFRDTFYVPRASMNKRRYWQGNGALCDWSGRLETGNPFTFALFWGGVVDRVHFGDAKDIGTCWDRFWDGLEAGDPLAGAFSACGVEDGFLFGDAEEVGTWNFEIRVTLGRGERDMDR
jgi:hypothetical protein